MPCIKSVEIRVCIYACVRAIDDQRQSNYTDGFRIKRLQCFSPGGMLCSSPGWLLHIQLIDISKYLYIIHIHIPTNKDVSAIDTPTQQPIPSPPEHDSIRQIYLYYIVRIELSVQSSSSSSSTGFVLSLVLIATSDSNWHEPIYNKAWRCRCLIRVQVFTIHVSIAGSSIESVPLIYITQLKLNCWKIYWHSLRWHLTKYLVCPHSRLFIFFSIFLSNNYNIYLR